MVALRTTSATLNGIGTGVETRAAIVPRTDNDTFVAWISLLNGTGSESYNWTIPVGLDNGGKISGRPGAYQKLSHSSL
jgi:hypothetical protein